MKKGKALIFSAPSGAGKTTIVRHLIQTFQSLDFSVSATTRPKRQNEQHGRDYYFLSIQDFRQKLEAGEFLEWEEVYQDVLYGTLKSELDRIWALGKHVIFDVDVEGGVNLKSQLGDLALSVFVRVDNIQTLQNRLEKRQSETSESLRARVEKAKSEMRFETKFDKVIVNNEIDQAFLEAEQLTRNFLAL